MRSILLVLGLAASSYSQSVSLPPLTGHLKVGTVALELLDKVRSRDLMVSIFYPTTPTYHALIAPVYSPIYAAYLAQSLSLPVALTSSLLSKSYAATPLQSPNPAYHHRHQPPIILFSPGAGGQRVDYTAALENLASHGFITIGIDHPNDTVFIDYPDGRTAFSTSISLNATTAATAAAVRAADMSFVLDALSQNVKLARKIPGVKKTLDVRRVGAFGHSLGGAACATAMLRDRRFACGANLDGSFWGDVVEKGVDGAFMIVGAEGRNRTSDPSWLSFWEKSKGRGFGREISVKGAKHGTFTDAPYLYELLVAAGVVPTFPADVLGTIGGKRILDVESAYLNAFFQRCFDHKHRTPKLLQGPSKAFPEVLFWPQ